MNSWILEIQIFMDFQIQIGEVFWVQWFLGFYHEKILQCSPRPRLAILMQRIICQRQLEVREG